VSDPRDDLYLLAALLADLDRVLHPFDIEERGDLVVTPLVPPPLPPVAPRSGPPRSPPSSTPPRQRSGSPAEPQRGQRRAASREAAVMENRPPIAARSESQEPVAAAAREAAPPTLSSPRAPAATEQPALATESGARETPRAEASPRPHAPARPQLARDERTATARPGTQIAPAIARPVVPAHEPHRPALARRADAVEPPTIEPPRAGIRAHEPLEPHVRRAAKIAQMVDGRGENQIYETPRHAREPARHPPHASHPEPARAARLTPRLGDAIARVSLEREADVVPPPLPRSQYAAVGFDRAEPTAETIEPSDSPEPAFELDAGDEPSADDDAITGAPEIRFWLRGGRLRATTSSHARRDAERKLARMSRRLGRRL
jgi:hypothetical protein